MRAEFAAALANIEAERARLDALATSTAGERHDSILHAIRDDLAKVTDDIRRLITLTAATAAPMPAQAPLSGQMLRVRGAQGLATVAAPVMIMPTAAPDIAPPEQAVAASWLEAGTHGIAPSGQPVDDLARIRGIDPELRDQLLTRGVTTFAAIAAWTGDDVRRMGAELGIGRQISRQNWIEQAALLRRPAIGAMPAPVPSAVAAPPARQSCAPQPAAATPDGDTTDRLDLVQGIDGAAAATLNAHGTRRWATIAAWSRADIDHIEAQLGSPGRVAKQGWIEQAALLAAGRSTVHALRTSRGDFAALVAPPPLEALDPPIFPVEHATIVVQPEIPEVKVEPIVVSPIFLAEPAPDSPAVASPPPETVDPPVADPEPLRVPAELAVATALPPPMPLLDRLAALERRTATLVAAESDRTDTLVPADMSELAAFTSSSPVPPAHSSIHIEDEEFAELIVDEADVVIVSRAPVVTVAQPRPDAATRGLLARLKRSPPLDDIDQATYAAYRTEIEEATVEIVKPGAKPTDRTR